jgi:diadenosine tetraphosphate (Ap4A) HIT family hydrolase
MNPPAIFELHPRLQEDCLSVGHFALCQLLLMNERRYPWLILVPKPPGVREIHELTDADQIRLIRESSALCRHLQQVFAPDKLNVAAIGNLVPQLHVHHVARFRDDPAWPAPVWGRFAPEPYAPEALEQILERLGLAELPGFTPRSSH